MNERVAAEADAGRSLCAPRLEHRAVAAVARPQGLAASRRPADDTTAAEAVGVEVVVVGGGVVVMEAAPRLQPAFLAFAAAFAPHAALCAPPRRKRRGVQRSVEGERPTCRLEDRPAVVPAATSPAGLRQRGRVLGGHLEGQPRLAQPLLRHTALLQQVPKRHLGAFCRAMRARARAHFSNMKRHVITRKHGGGGDTHTVKARHMHKEAHAPLQSTHKCSHWRGGRSSRRCGR